MPDEKLIDCPECPQRFTLPDLAWHLAEEHLARWRGWGQRGNVVEIDCWCGMRLAAEASRFGYAMDTAAGVLLRHLEAVGDIEAHYRESVTLKALREL